MSDISTYLPESRALFRAFMSDHFADYFETMRRARVGPGTGYPGFYRDSEVIQHLRDIVHNLEETFGDVSIPGFFASPKQLVDTWGWFHRFLVDRDTELFKDVDEHLDRAEHPPGWLTTIAEIHNSVMALLAEILSMPEVKEYGPKPTSDAPPTSRRFDVIVITALHDTEFEALKGAMPGFIRFLEPNDATEYWEGMLAGKRILLATDDRMGMAAAASLTTKVIAKFRPDYVIMAGIAAGVEDPSRDFGDILVTRITWNYDSGKYQYDPTTKTTAFKPRPEQLQLKASMVPHINALRSDKKLLSSIRATYVAGPNDKTPLRDPVVHMGPLASGSAVLADKNKVATISLNHSKLMGIDMETFGVFYAAQSFAMTEPTVALSIKSISDLADHHKNDAYRNYAAHTSARFVRELIIRHL